MIRKYKRKIERKKALLNFLLKYLSINNRLILYLSQNLDNLINEEQLSIYSKYFKKTLRRNPIKKAA